MKKLVVQPRKRTGDGSSFGTAGIGKGKGKMPTPQGRLRISAAQRAASNRKD